MAKIVEMDIRKATTKELIKYIQSEGKKANTALVALENAKLEKQSFAYQYLSSKKTKFVSTSKTGHMKINLNTKNKSRNELTQIASVIQGYRTAKTSTVGQTRKHYKESFKSFKKSAIAKGLNVTQEQFADILDTVGYKSFIKQFGFYEFVEVLKDTENPTEMIEILESVGELKTLEDVNEYKERLNTKELTGLTDVEIDKFLDNGYTFEQIQEEYKGYR